MVLTEEIKALTDKMDALYDERNKHDFVMYGEKKKHPRSYERRADYIEAKANYDRLTKEAVDVHAKLIKATEEYHESLRAIDKAMVDEVCAEAQKTEDRGYWRLATICRRSRMEYADTIEIDGIVWENEYEGFVKALNKYDIKKLAVIDESTALKGTLMMLIADGWRVTGIYSRRKPVFNEWAIDYCYREANGLLLEK